MTQCSPGKEGGLHTHTKPNGQKETVDGESGSGVGQTEGEVAVSRKKDEKDWLEEKIKLNLSPLGKKWTFY